MFPKKCYVYESSIITKSQYVCSTFLSLSSFILLPNSSRQLVVFIPSLPFPNLNNQVLINSSLLLTLCTQNSTSITTVLLSNSALPIPYSSILTFHDTGSLSSSNVMAPHIMKSQSLCMHRGAPMFSVWAPQTFEDEYSFVGNPVRYIVDFYRYMTPKVSPGISKHSLWVTVKITSS